MTWTGRPSEAARPRGEAFSRILIATDGSADARLASRAAIDLARHPGAVLDIVSAWAVPTWPYGIYGVGGSGFAEMLEAVEADSRAHAQDVATGAQECGVHVGRVCVMRDPAAEATIAVAAELGDDLIVVGSRGLGRVSRVLLGSVSEAIVHHARRPVLVMRGGDGAWPPRLIIAADDGDDATTPALRRAAAIAHLFEAPLELVQVVPPMSRFSRFSEEDALAAVRAHLGTRAGGLSDLLGTHPESEVCIGDPAAELLDVSSSHEGCVLVVGSHGRTTLNRLRLGSVSTNLVHAAECPVLVVPNTVPAVKNSKPLTPH